MNSRQHIKFFIETLGCSKNQVDSESMLASIERSGWSFTEDPDQASFIIINTCGFIKASKEQSIEVFLDYRERYPEAKIVIAGCFAQRYFDEIATLFPDADGFYGSQAPSTIAQIIEDVLNGNCPALKPSDDLTQLERNKFFSYKKSVYVKIAEGCNNNCNYCAIPLIRGPLKSRTLEDVYEEIKTLIEKGHFELNLIAQDLASWGQDLGAKTLVKLLEMVSELEGEFWLRLLYIHPDNFPYEVLELCKKDKRILPYFDIPFQHASEKVLKGMGRKGSFDKYLELVKKIRTELPESILRSTFMVGFPGEGKKEFQEVVDFLQEAQLDWAGFFVYSREEDTVAYKMRGALATKLVQKTAEKRKAQLETLQASITEERLKRFVGKEMEIFVEEKVEKENLSLGRAYIDAPEVDGLVVLRGTDLEAGQVVKATIQRSEAVDLIAEINS